MDYQAKYLQLLQYLEKTIKDAIQHGGTQSEVYANIGRNVVGNWDVILQMQKSEKAA